MVKFIHLHEPDGSRVSVPVNAIISYSPSLYGDHTIIRAVGISSNEISFDVKETVDEILEKINA